MTYKKFTDLDVAIAKAINPKYKWIVRDSDGTLSVYADKPSKYNSSNGDSWWNNDEFNDDFCVLWDENGAVNAFLGITSDDETPTRIADIINPPLLTDEERKELSYLLKPYKYRVMFIEKNYKESNTNHDYECICVNLANSAIAPGEFWELPCFIKGSEYQGMKLDKPYTIEELKLF